MNNSLRVSTLPVCHTHSNTALCVLFSIISPTPRFQTSLTCFSRLVFMFVLKDGPIWMDSSTARECQALETAMGGAQRVADVSGSRAYERFTGNQIAKMFRSHPSEMEDCERVSLVSSFIACLFAGSYVPIDSSDGSGMNLMDIRSDPPQWSPELCRASVGEERTSKLVDLLGEAPVPAHAVVGQVASYFCERYGFQRECRVVAGSGDNPCSLVGLLLHEAGDVAISLGTSDTVSGCAILCAVLETDV